MTSTFNNVLEFKGCIFSIFSLSGESRSQNEKESGDFAGTVTATPSLGYGENFRQRSLTLG